jgi:hypothetical protein
MFGYSRRLLSFRFLEITRRLNERICRASHSIGLLATSKSSAERLPSMGKRVAGLHGTQLAIGTMEA